MEQLSFQQFQQSNRNIFSKSSHSAIFVVIQPICLFCHPACFSSLLSPFSIDSPCFGLPSPIAQSYLRLALSRTCQKESRVVNMYRWCWMIGRWRCSVLLEAWSMASRSADQHLSPKQENKKKTKKNIWHEHSAERESTELGGGSEPCRCWLGIMMYGSDQTACWAIMWEQGPPPAPDSFSRPWWMATRLSDELSREHAWRLNSPY